MHTEMNKESVLMKSVLRDRDGFKDRSYDRYLDADQLKEVLQQQQQHQQQQEDEHASGRRIGLDADVDVGAALTQTVSSDGIKDVVDIGDNDDDGDNSLSFVLSNDGLLLDGLRNDGNAAGIANGDGMTTVGSHDDIDDDDGMEEGKLSTLVRAHLLEVETGSAYCFGHHRHPHQHHYHHHHLLSSPSSPLHQLAQETSSQHYSTGVRCLKVSYISSTAI